MSNIDPVKRVKPSAPAPMAPMSGEDRLEMSEVEAGMEAAENDTRDVIQDLYEAAALVSDDPDEALDDIDYTLSDGGDITPELSAIHDETDVDFEVEEE